MDGEIQFLNLRLSLNEGLRGGAESSLRNFFCALTVATLTAKRRLVLTLVKNSFKKSCVDKVQNQFKNVVNQVKLGGYSTKWVNEAIIFTIKQSVLREKLDLNEPKTIALHFYHRVSDNLKSMAQKSGVTIAFHNDYHLARLTLFRYTSAQRCEIPHRERDLNCAFGGGLLHSPCMWFVLHQIDCQMWKFTAYGA